MIIAGIDPGTTKSAHVLYDTETQKVFGKTIKPNMDLLNDLGTTSIGMNTFTADYLICEMPVSYGETGKDIDETIYWVGQFVRQWANMTERPYGRVYRHDVLIHFFGKRWFKDDAGKRRGYKDPHVRAYLIKKWGGEHIAIGNKKCFKCKGKGWFGKDHAPCRECDGGGYEFPAGPLHGVATHMWAALAVAVTWNETRGHKLALKKAQ